MTDMTSAPVNSISVSDPTHGPQLDSVPRGSLDLGTGRIDVQPSDQHVDAPIAPLDPQTVAQDRSLRDRVVPRWQSRGALGGVLATTLAVGGTGATLVTAGKGALIGAALGSIIPGAGTIVGAVVGGIVGGIGAALVGGLVGRWAAGGGGRDKADRAIIGLRNEGKLSAAEATRLKGMDSSELKALISVSKRRTGIASKADRDAVRRTVLLAAAKRGPAAAREVKANLLHLANSEDLDRLRNANDNYIKAQDHLVPDDDPRFDGIRGNPIREAAYRSLFLGKVEGAWSVERNDQQLRSYSQQALDQIADKTDQQLSEPHHYYNPFRGGAVRGDSAMASARHKYAGKAHFNLIDAQSTRPWQAKPLADVGNDEVLVVDGHGGDRMDALGIQEGPRRGTRMTAEQLAKQLEDEGLSKDHGVIRLISCYAGGSTLESQGGNFRGALNANKSDDVFAARLAKALHVRGYRNIVVGGYPGAVHNIGGGSKTITTSVPGNAYTIRASGLCNYYDGQGQPVANPRNPDKALLSDHQKDQMIIERNHQYGRH